MIDEPLYKKKFTSGSETDKMKITADTEALLFILNEIKEAIKRK